MRFRPANIRLINRRSNLPRLLLALSSINGKNNDKNNTTNVQGLTGHSISGLIIDNENANVHRLAPPGEPERRPGPRNLDRDHKPIVLNRGD